MKKLFFNVWSTLAVVKNQYQGRPAHSEYNVSISETTGKTRIQRKRLKTLFAYS